MKTLVEDMTYWRAERPDEWKMDEFIRGVKERDKRIAKMKAGLKEILDCDSYGYTKNAEFVSRVASRVLISEGGEDD